MPNLIEKSWTVSTAVVPVSPPTEPTTYDSEKYRFSTSNDDDIDNPEPHMHNGVNAFLKLHPNFDVSAKISIFLNLGLRKLSVSSKTAVDPAGRFVILRHFSQHQRRVNTDLSILAF